MNIWIIFYVGSGLQLKHMEKVKIEQPRGDVFHLRDGLAAGAFIWAVGVGGPCVSATSVSSLGPLPS